MTHFLRLTRDGAEVARVRIPRADYLAIRRCQMLSFPARRRSEALVVEVVTPGRVYRLSVERDRAK